MGLCLLIDPNGIIHQCRPNYYQKAICFTKRLNDVMNNAKGRYFIKLQKRSRVIISIGYKGELL
jgi:hypothetical protein